MWKTNDMKSTTSELMLFIKLRESYCFNNIILQPALFADDQVVDLLFKKKWRCYLKDAMSSAIKRCRSGKRQSPDLKPLTENVGKVHCNISKKGKLNIFLLNKIPQHTSVGQLDSFPVIDQKQHGVAKSSIGYLVIIDTPATYISTVYHACNWKLFQGRKNFCIRTLKIHLTIDKYAWIT